MKKLTTLIMALIISIVSAYADCASDYNAALQAANDAYATCTQAAVDAYNATVASALQTKTQTIASIWTNYHDGAISEFIRDNQINAAVATYDAAVQAAQNTRDAAIAACLATGLAAYKAAHQAYADCIRSEHRMETGILPDDVSLGNNLIQNVFPNPSHGFVSVDYNVTASDDIKIRVFDLSNRNVFSQTEAAVVGDQQFDLILPQLLPGIYFLEITDGSVISRKKFIVQ